MSHEIFSREWAIAWHDEILASERYRQGALCWRFPLLLVLRETAGDGALRAVFLDPGRAECRAIRGRLEEAAERAEFVLSAEATVWQQVMTGRVDPLIGLLAGKLTLEKGRLVDFGSRSRAARALLATAGRVSGAQPGLGALTRASWPGDGLRLPAASDRRGWGWSTPLPA